ncbi:MAG: alpha/beta hydrolase [Sphingobacteriales bacterium]|nr:MAG: alpha/beta hydrolase [Sphingobacteriales bacterium]
MRPFRGLYIVTICLLLSLTANAQDYFNSDAFWGKLQLDSKRIETGETKIDTAIVVATNRALQPNDKLRFMSEEADTGIVRYYYVYAYGGKWHVLQAENLQKAIGYLPRPNRDWVIYTEGMGKIFTNDIDRGMRLTAQYNVNVLLMDYPSIRSNTKRIPNYKFAIKHARVAYKDFAPVLDTLQQLRAAHRMGNGKLSLFFHSMGNNVMSKTVTSGKVALLNDKAWVDNIILNAPCVPEKRHRRWVDKLIFAQHVYVHYNPRDHTLQGAHLLSFKKQLGEKVKKPISKQATYINFNSITDRGHSNFIYLPGREPAQPASIKHYNTLFHGNEVDVSDTTRYRPTQYHHIGYDLLP